MLYRLCALAYIAAVSAGSIELVSGSIGKGGVGLDNIKGKMSQVCAARAPCTECDMTDRVV